ncbi:MAG: hypothetical protein ACE5D4_07060 [Thermodesulfobacteriota bacterium]
MKTGEEIEVEAYSGFKANERPKTFTVAGRKIEAEEIVEMWRGEEYDYFKINGDDGQLYTIRYDRGQDGWELL